MRVLGRILCLAIGCIATVGAVSHAASPLVDRIDESLVAHWSEQGIEPTSAASDAAFLRRVSLDLAGVTPSLAEARDFLADAESDKRERLVDRLLASPRYAAHMANTWRDLLIPADDGNFMRREQAIGLHNWLRDRFGRNVRYDNLVYDLLVATDASDLGPASYFAAHELKPEKIAANTSKLLLGVSLDCAQCHDHPYTHWSEKDFWAYAAFFARVRTIDGSDQMTPGQRATKLVDADSGELYRQAAEGVDDKTPIPPKYLGGEEATENEYETRREQLALWMAERENPYLARAVVNASWRRLFGTGLVEEIDADGDHFPTDHAALLDEISEAFVAADFDLQWLWRQLTATRAYGLSGMAKDAEPPPLPAFAAMQPRRLTAEQLADSIARLAPSVTASENPFDPDPSRERFVNRMRASSSNALEYTGSTLQSLQMLNGPAVQGAAAPNAAGFIPALSAPHLSNEERIAALFLATLTRGPTENERELFATHLNEFGQGSDRPTALGDLLWTLLNGTEMVFNR